MHTICQITLIINCVELDLYFCAFRVFSELAGSVIKQKQTRTKIKTKNVCDRQSSP